MVKVVVNDSKGLVQSAGTGVQFEKGLKCDEDLKVRGVLVEKLVHADADSRHHTLTIAEIVDGILVHTSVTGAGVLTTPTAALIMAGSSGKGVLSQNGDCLTMDYINDGNQTVTVTGGSNVTVIGYPPRRNGNTPREPAPHRRGGGATTCQI